MKSDVFKYGWAGTILRVDLNKEKIVKQPLSKELAYNYIGGRGVNLKMLYDETKPGISPFDPENRLIVGAGPCNGTLIPGSIRIAITTKSPLTGFIGDSNSGASLGAQLKYAGYDVVVFQGKADKPTYLWIDDDHVKLKDARHLWGKTTRETERMIQKDQGDPDISIVSVGPAGENMVRFASIIAYSEGRACARTGVGAVMGSKKLKAIAVRGTKGVKVANPVLLERAIRRVSDLARDRDKLVDANEIEGLLSYNKLGILPTRNYQTGIVEDEVELLSSDAFVNLYSVGVRSCFSCPSTTCSRLYVIGKGPHTGMYSSGLELCSIEQLGPRIGIKDWDSMLKLHELCNLYGLDVCDAGGVMGFAMECYEKGILTKNDVDDLRLEWGNVDAIMKLQKMIVYRRGFGDVLAEGLKRAPQIVGRGSEKYALHVKGMGLSTLDPRGVQSWGLGYAVSNRGASHTRAMPPENRNTPYRFVIKRAGELIAFFENILAIEDCLQICKNHLETNVSDEIRDSIRKGEQRDVEQFTRPLTQMQLFNAVTGLRFSVSELLMVGERIINLERMFNVREGLTRKDDTLPERFLRVPMPDGPSKGQVVKLQPMLHEYYESRGWDKKTGIPTRKKLIELGLIAASEELENL